MKNILEEFGGAVIYVIAGGGFIGIFCLLLDVMVGF